MGWWGRKKTVIDEQPKTDNLQPNQPAGDTLMANTVSIPVSINPQSAQSLAYPLNAQGGLNALYGNLYGNTGVGLSGLGGATCVTTTNPGPFVYTNIVPQYHQYYAAAGAGGWSPITIIADGAPPSPSRSEFTEEEIEQAERIMEELSA